MLWLKCSLFSSLSSLSHYHLFFHCHTVAAFISLLLLSFPTCVPSSVFCIFPEPLLTGLVPSILTFNLSLASFLSSVFSPFLPSLFFTYSSMMRLFTFSLFDWQMIHIQPRVLVWIITHFLLCLSTFLCFLLFSPHITCLTNNSSNLLFLCVCVLKMTSVVKLLLIKIDLNTSIKGQQPPLDLQRRAAAAGIIKPALGSIYSCWCCYSICTITSLFPNISIG